MTGWAILNVQSWDADTESPELHLDDEPGGGPAHADPGGHPQRHMPAVSNNHGLHANNCFITWKNLNWVFYFCFLFSLKETSH